MFKVQEGFGPVTDSLEQCWDVADVATFDTAADAEAHSAARYESEVTRLMTDNPDWWQSYWVRVVEEPTLYYAAYESTDASGYDADYQGGFATKEEATSVAREWLSFASGDRDSVYVVAVPADWQERDGSELPSLWDHLHTIPRDRWTFLHGNPDEYFA